MLDEKVVEAIEGAIDRATGEIVEAIERLQRELVDETETVASSVSNYADTSTLEAFAERIALALERLSPPPAKAKSTARRKGK